MKAYIGLKIIQAEPGPAPDGHAQAGEMGYIVRYEDGYLSWSPTKVFQRAYREITDAEKNLIG